MEEKRCPKCKETKSVDEFYSDKSRPDGRKSWCKVCLRTGIKKWEKENPDKRKEYEKRWRDKHPEECRAKCNKWRRENPEKYRASQEKSREKHRERYRAKNREAKRKYLKEHPDMIKNSQLKTTYGITLDEYNGMLKAQGDKCAICDEVPSEKKKRFAVDHDHTKSGRESVRGILCTKCNFVLGLCNDDIRVLEAMIDYLKRWNFSGGEA